MNGNVREWNEALIGSSRALRGGLWYDGEDVLRSSVRTSNFPTGEFHFDGFRLASPVPGPGSVTLLAVGARFSARRRH
ncbi:MAG: hypothetical protein AAF297_00800 [Planctomycetota bacterium]